MKRFVALVLFMIVAVPAYCQAPDVYQSIGRIAWVVKDAEKATEGWKKFGLTDIETRGDIDLPIEYRGKPLTAKVRWVTGWIGPIAIDWIQPLGANDPYAGFLARRGEGVMALLYQAPSSASVAAELERMNGFGIGVLMRGAYKLPSGSARFVVFDTEPQGKFAIGMVEGETESATAHGSAAITHFGGVARNIRAVSAFWTKVGFPKIKVVQSTPTNYQYRGRPAHFSNEIGFYRRGKVNFEWCTPVGGEDVYGPFLAQHGEGIQHLGFTVPDMDRAIAGNKAPVAQSGGWGEQGQKGSGRFAYLDTDAIGGLAVEYIWNFK